MAHNMRRLIVMLLVSGLCGTACARSLTDSAITGHVKDSEGKPQMGALIEIFTSASVQPLKTFTDAKGYYAVKGLPAGNYFVKATATSFLPSLRENIDVKPGATALVNLTLNTLVEAFQLLPARRKLDQNDDDWKWTLRSAANRPILRVLEDDGPLVVVSHSDKDADRTLKARVAFIAGSSGDAMNGSDVKTNFTLEQSIFGTGTMQFNGNVGYNAGYATGIVRAAYKRETPDGSHAEIAVTARHFATPDTALHHAALNALAVTMADGFTVGDFLEVNAGSELQAVQFRGRVLALRPFGSVAAHLSDSTVVEYRYATSMPNTRMAKGFDSSPMDLSETNPRVSMLNGQPLLERGQHHEISFARKLGKNNLQVAYFNDHVADPALTGVGGSLGLLTNDIEASDFLPDPYSATFAFSGRSFSSQGGRVVAQRKFNDALTATVDYGFGSALSATGQGFTLGGLEPNDLFTPGFHHSLAVKASGKSSFTKTRWLASYKWTSGSRILTQVDSFNASAGQSDPFLNIFIRQPIPGTSFLPGKMEALVDVRNLLAQGYVPMLGADGRTLYLVQSARSIRTGVAFNF